MLAHSPRACALVLILLLAPAAASKPRAAVPLSFRAAHVEAALLPREATLAHIVIHNRGRVDDRLEQVWFSAAQRTHIVRLSGLSTDKRGVPIPAGKTVALGRSGEAILLVDLKISLVPPGPVRAILHFEKAGDVPVDFTILPVPKPVPPWP